jgi:hypothetical protein
MICLVGLLAFLFVISFAVNKSSSPEPPHPEFVAAPPGRTVSPPLNPESSKVKPLTPKEKVAVRKLVAEMMDRKMLQAGYNVEISDLEGRKPALHIKYALMNRALVYQIMQKLDADDLWNEGFKQVILTDGYDDTWTYTANGHK